MSALPPDPEGMNDLRAEWAGDALWVFSEHTGQNPATDGWGEIVGDFLCDLRHFCDRNDIKFEELVEQSRGCYREETSPDT